MPIKQEIIEMFMTLAYDSWGSPESVATALVTIISALSAAVIGIIQAFRSIDRKNGKECCRFTGKRLNGKESDKKDAKNA